MLERRLECCLKAILLREFGGPQVLTIGEAARPLPLAGQVLIEVAATSVNRPDMIQREGRYPPPPGESEILGLEVAGGVIDIGPGVPDTWLGRRVMALIGGGGYAEYATAYAGHLIPIPDSMSFEQAACIPEAYITAYQNLFINAHVSDGESMLLHGGGGGVNTAAIQISKALAPHSKLLVTASARKVERVRELGADLVIDYENEDFCEAVAAFTGKRGVDVVLDHVGAAYFERNLRSLAVGGRLAIIATISGREAELDLARLMVKRQTIIGSVLRPRPLEEKAAIVASFSERVLPHLESGAITPIIYEVLPLEEAASAHAIMESRTHFGKIVLSVGKL